MAAAVRAHEDTVNNDVTTRAALHEKRSVKCGAGTISP